MYSAAKRQVEYGPHNKGNLLLYIARKSGCGVNFKDGLIKKINGVYKSLDPFNFFPSTASS